MQLRIDSACFVLLVICLPGLSVGQDAEQISAYIIFASGLSELS